MDNCEGKSGETLSSVQEGNCTLKAFEKTACGKIQTKSKILEKFLPTAAQVGKPARVSAEI